MRPGRPADLAALLEVEKRLVRAGVFNCVPTASWYERMLGDFDWAARSRVIEEASTVVAGVLVVDRPIPEGILARAEVVAGPELLVPLAEWGIALSRAAGAWGVQLWRGRGHAEGLERTGLRLARGFWRMDRRNLLAVPAIPLAEGYRLTDGADPDLSEERWLETYELAFAEQKVADESRAFKQQVGLEAADVCAVTLSDLEDSELGQGAHRLARAGIAAGPGADSILQLLMAEADPLRRALAAARCKAIGRRQFSVVVADSLAALPPGPRHALAA